MALARPSHMSSLTSPAITDANINGFDILTNGPTQSFCYWQPLLSIRELAVNSSPIKPFSSPINQYHAQRRNDRLTHNTHKIISCIKYKVQHQAYVTFRKMFLFFGNRNRVVFCQQWHHFRVKKSRKIKLTVTYRKKASNINQPFYLNTYTKIGMCSI